jgi:plasmid stability protein
MPSITVKNIPPDLYRRLKRAAAMNRRSINSEILVCVERALRSRKIAPKMVLVTARKLRAKTSGHPITDDEITQAKATGRV